MSLNLTDSSLDDSIDEQQLELENSDFSDPYIVAVMLEQQDLGTLEDIGFQDYMSLIQE